MPHFHVVGRGRDSGRERKRTYSAANEYWALKAAEADGTEVESIAETRTPATERQVAYARDLGLQFPDDITVDEMSDLLDCRLSDDKPSTDRHREFALSFGVQCNRYTGKRRLFEQIAMYLQQDGHELDLAAWFVYRVCRNLWKGSDPPGVEGPNSPLIRDIATSVSSDSAAMKSIRRYRGEDLIRFGEWTTPSGYLATGGSTKTIGYRQATSLLRSRLAAPVI
ncbi:MAG: hypothetical protein L0219_14195 [Phycisphaerales bacterium]|nr:hypothetical protein [Phycisphaerales bacterium]MCI0676452.1 hypothetical protein [Phycisphaerales bacterium]